MFAALLLACAMTGPVSAQDLRQAIGRDMGDLMTLYRDLHQHPELSMQETRSAARMAEEARRAGFTVTTGVGGTGVVAVMENGPGPVLLVRADMDALPVEEQTGLAFASRVRGTSLAGVESGVMHACGHDTHMTTWVGTARRLAAMRAQWSGTLVMVAQPGEEIGAGARAMLDDGLFTRFPHPTHALAFHDSASLPAGVIGYSVGPALANVDSVDIDVRGVGGHGAYPHTTRDPIVLASRIVTTLQTLVSREINPLDSAVVTVGSFHAGTKHNIISDDARLQLTVRSFTPEIRRQLLDGIARIARGEAIAAGVAEDRMPVVTVQDAQYTPATVNTEGLTQSTAALFRQHFGEARVQQTPPVMGGEDFSRYHIADPRIESLIFWVGGVPQARWDAVHGDVNQLPSLHSPFWAPEAETVIATATEAMTVAAMGVLGRR
ncbi:MAG TPA: amidohydrolase [Allosphingosinicella sp.]|nr:amidohydrolase [Allosphingosinicella sp.]